jgi:hypothetical protein
MVPLVRRSRSGSSLLVALSAAAAVLLLKLECGATSIDNGSKGTADSKGAETLTALAISNVASCTGVEHEYIRWQGYNLLTPDVIKLTIPYESPTLRLQAAFSKASNGGTVNVTVLGGSATIGTGLPSGQSHELRWTSLLQTWLRKRFPMSDITVGEEWAAFPQYFYFQLQTYRINCRCITKLLAHVG